jgi:hypothetical protein
MRPGGTNAFGTACFSKPRGFEMVHGIAIAVDRETSEFKASLTNKFRHRQTASQSSLSQAGSSMMLASASTSTSLGSSLARKQQHKWVELTGTVLKFDATFKESVAESMHNGENFRVRPCAIYYYCEDDTIQVNEPKTENSGLPQGNLMKRHKIPKDWAMGVPTDGGTEYYAIDELVVGATVTFYGRTFHIHGCNKSTADFLAANYGRDDGARGSAPVTVDPFTESKAAQMMRETGADQSISRNQRKGGMKKFMEATLGNTVDNSRLQGFKDHDREVLRFQCVWDDRGNMFGDQIRFTLHYFLADDTCEVLDVPFANNGKDPFPLLLKRQRLERVWHTDTMNGRSDVADPAGFVHWKELKIGGLINVYGRSILLVDADPATASFYARNGMQLQPALEVMDPGASDFTPVFSERGYGTNALGTEEDSMANCLRLVPKAPKTEFDVHGCGLPQSILRFKTRFAGTPLQDDAGREFIIQYFVGDASIQITELVTRNSGIVGGKFLQKGKYVNAATGKQIHLSDLYPGALLTVTDFQFLVTEADQHTADYMRKTTDL